MASRSPVPPEKRRTLKEKEQDEWSLDDHPGGPIIGKRRKRKAEPRQIGIQWILLVLGSLLVVPASMLVAQLVGPQGEAWAYVVGFILVTANPVFPVVLSLTFIALVVWIFFFGPPV